MFDIGFWELCLVGIVGLIVIGPEKLPKVARIAGLWIGKTRNMVSSVQAEIKQELQAEEMRQIIKEQTALEEFHQLADEGSKVVNDIASTINTLPNENVKKKIDDSK